MIKKMDMIMRMIVTIEMVRFFLTEGIYSYPATVLLVDGMIEINITFQLQII